MYNELPRGLDLSYDLRMALPGFSPEVIFDVGANEGESALWWHQRFPKAIIHCFEPVPSTFEILQSNTSTIPQIRNHLFALSSKESQSQMVLEGSSKMHYLDTSPNKYGSDAIKIPVSVLTLDKFCHSHQIPHIHLLKIDTEGNDLEVLKGAQGLIQRHAIDVLQVEAGMYTGNTRHVHFIHFQEWLEKYNYVLFGLYEQYFEWTTRSPQLRRANLVYISPKVMNCWEGKSKTIL